MKSAVLALLASALFAPAALAAAPSDVTVPIRQFIEGFNNGDLKSAYASLATGDITIVDEFAPHLWTGSQAAQQWVADYDTHAKATGVSDGMVQYGAPTRNEIQDDLAYVIVPTVYLYKEHGQHMAEEGQLTFVLHAEAGAWKIRSWIWSGVKPHPAKSPPRPVPAYRYLSPEKQPTSIPISLPCATLPPVNAFSAADAFFSALLKFLSNRRESTQIFPARSPFAA